MKMRINFIWILFLFVSACSSKNATQVSDAQENYPLDTRTGITEIDSILDAVASGEPQKISALINYTTAPCTTAEGLGGPPKCNKGEPDGTPLEVLPVIGSEGGFIRKSEMGSWQGVQGDAIYAIYRIAESAPVEEYYPLGEYVILLTVPENQYVIAIRVGDGGVVRLDYLFETSPEALNELIKRDAIEVILAPKIR